LQIGVVGGDRSQLGAEILGGVERIAGAVHRDAEEVVGGIEEIAAVSLRVHPCLMDGVSGSGETDILGEGAEARAGR